MNQEKNNLRNFDKRSVPHRDTISNNRKISRPRELNQRSNEAIKISKRDYVSLQERVDQRRNERQTERNLERKKPTKTVRKKKKMVARGNENYLVSNLKKLRMQPPDHIIFDLTIVLLAIGLLMVFSASSYRSILEFGNPFNYFVKQSFFAVLGLLCMVACICINPELLQKSCFIFLVIATILIAYTAFRGENTLGATRWITIAGIRFTPAELAKPFMILCLSDLLKDDLSEVLKDRYKMIVSIVLIGTLLLIAKEDLGSCITVAAGCFALLVVAGISKKAILGIMGTGIMGIVILIMIEPYRVQRLFGFIQRSGESATSGAAYQITQSLYAFGSGGLLGTGIGNGGQKLLYLPGMHTDFIYSVLGEELGFIGAVIVLVLFFLFVWRGYWLSWMIEDKFKSFVAFGITSLIGVQAFINIGVSVGILPVTGITLPLISYGGTSLLITLSSIGLLLNMTRFAQRKKR